MARAARMAWVLGGIMAVAAAAFGAEPPAEQPEKALSRLVEDQCVLFTTIPSLKAALDALKTLGPYRLVADPESQAFLKSGGKWVDQALTSEFKTTAGSSAAAADKFVALFDRQVSLAAFELGERKTDLVALVESSQGPDGAEKWLDEMVKDKALERYVGTKVEPLEIGAGKAFFFRLGELPVCLAARGTFLLVATSKQRLTDTLAALDKPPQRPLETSPLFVRARQVVGGDRGQLFLFLNVARLFDQAMQRAPGDPDLREARRWLDFDFAAASVRAENGRALSKIHLLPRAGQTETFLKFLGRQPNPLATMELVPGRAFLFISANLSLPVILKAISDSPQFLEDVFGLRPGDAMRAEAALKSLGGALNGEASVFIQLPFGGGMFPEGALLARTDDPPALEGALQDVLKLGHRPPQSVPFLGTKIYSLGPDEQAFIPNPTNPALAIIGRNFVFAVPGPTAKTLVRLSQQPANLFRETPAFKAIPAGAGKTPAAILHLDTRSLVLYIYNTLTPFLSAFQGDGPDFDGPPGFGRPRQAPLPFNLQLLPTAETLSKYIAGMGASFQWEGDGLSAQISSDGFDPVALALQAEAFAPYYLPYAFLLQRREVTESCQRNIQVWFQRGGFPGRDRAFPQQVLPPTQEEFARRYLPNRPSLVCPADQAPVHVGAFSTSYEYFPEKYKVTFRINRDTFRRAPRFPQEGVAYGDTIILYDSQPRHQAGRCVLTPSGPRWMAEEEFQKALRAQLDQQGLK